MLFLETEPFVRQAVHSRLDMKNATKDLFHPLQTRDSRLFYIVSGKGEMFVDGISYPIKNDMILLFRAGTPYEWRVEYADYYAVNFDYNMSFSDIRETFHPIYSEKFNQEMIFDCGEILDAADLNSPIVIYQAIPFKHGIQNIITESAIKDGWNRPLLSTMTKRIILEILRAKANKSKDILPVNNIKEIIAYVQDNYIESITNQMIAEKFGYNPTYLGRIFKAQTGVTLHEFVIDLRLNAAMELLAETSLAVGEISKQVGFTDVYHFSKYFKARIGKTPSQYRRS